MDVGSIALSPVEDFWRTWRADLFIVSSGSHPANTFSCPITARMICARTCASSILVHRIWPIISNKTVLLLTTSGTCFRRCRSCTDFMSWPSGIQFACWSHAFVPERLLWQFIILLCGFFHWIISTRSLNLLADLILALTSFIGYLIPRILKSTLSRWFSSRVS